MSISADTRRATAIVLDGTALDPGALGGKGAALDRLISWGIAVPATAVVTATAYRRFLEAPAIGDLVGAIRGGSPVEAAEVDRVFGAVEFPPEVAQEVIAAARAVSGGCDLAVRSSATVEDLAGASFAGQYRSVLAVEPQDAGALLDAVRAVFASLWHPAPCAYRAALGIDDSDAAMAAVLMQMVPAKRAGVVFTVDPGGAPDTARVEAVDGLAESLVSGQQTPDAWTVSRGRSGFDGPVEIALALEAALTIERHAGMPQDVEWAWDGEHLWIVQARPITTGGDLDGDGFDSAVDDAELTTAGIGEMLPGVLPPLRWQINAHLVNEAFRRLVADLGVETQLADPRPRPFVRRVRGRAAMDLDALRDLAVRLPGGSAEELERQYFGSRRPGRPAAAPATEVTRREAIAHDLRALRIQRRSSVDAEVTIHAMARFGDRPCLDAWDVPALLAYLFRLVDLGVRAVAAELEVAASATSSYRKIELLLIGHLGDEAAGRWAERVTAGRGIAASVSPTASAAVFAGPTWIELGTEPPTSEMLGRGVHADPFAAEDDLMTLLASVPSWGSSGLRTALRRRGLGQVIDAAVTLLRRREATKAALMELGGEVRRVILEIGARLVEAGVLDDPADIELLTMAELRAGCRGDGIAPNDLARRRRWLDRYRAEPPLPIRFSGMPTPEPVALPDGGRLEGWAASPGRLRGLGVVVDAPTDTHFPPGAVLVAAATDASWSPLFVKAGAVVVERGGPLSHAAILARELGVPAVSNVAGATQLLSGRSVTVDGDLGVVVVHDDAVPDGPGAPATPRADR
ncbi:PEP/pyruvate-binding domain-containing protein [Nodularia spumigena]|uniref:PEP/pyruvate-binding domain-containing protein n=1 Tax=Nodularia spumigena TaxID=70799 RepID=UPI002B20EFE2|nr:PEP/pyruvate-binding domain-containing protein [Nodularia spumigena]MEA5558037.1 PEP/pyruvate-binding domain-containing protein [Nodularia spumigena CH309]